MKRKQNRRVGFVMRNYRTLLLRSSLLVFSTVLLSPAVSSRAQALQVPDSTDVSSQRVSPAAIPIENVFHVVGLEAKAGAAGDLIFDDKAMTFRVHDHSTVIPLRSILAFSIVQDDKPLIHGTKGKLAEMAPYGVGIAVAMTRPSAEILTLFYRDSQRAIHGCVLVLPKDSEERVDAAFAREKLSPADYPKTGGLLPSEAQPASGGQRIPASGPAKPSVEVALPSESVDDIPSAFPAAVFEDLIKQLTQSGLFAHVWRAGDVNRASDALVLHIDFENWKKGSVRKRSLVPFTGGTAIKANVKLVDASGRIVFQNEVDGAKRTNGESLDVANSLAKHVKKALEKAPDLQPTMEASK